MKTTRTFTLPLLLASSAVLTACGGGSDSSDTGGTGGNNTVALSASVVQSTVCNTTVPASTAELIVYDNNWAIKSRHKADASGKINASIPKTDYVNISFVGTDGVGSARRIDIDTYAQHPVGDLGVYTIPGASNQGCECQTTNITVTSTDRTLLRTPHLTGYNTNKPLDSYNSYDGSVNFYNVELCRSLNSSSWPTLYSATNSSESFKAAGFLSGYDPASSLTLMLDQSPTTYSVNFDYAANSTSVMHHFGDDYFSNSEPGSSSSAEIFDNIPNLSAISFRSYEGRTDYYNDIRVNIGRSQRHSVAAPYTGTVDVTLPDQQGPEELLQATFAWLNSESDSYDFGGISDFETFSITLAANLTDGSSYYQSFYGPKQGSLPSEPLPADYGVEPLLNEDDVVIYVGMFRYGEQQTYQQYLTSKTAASKMPLSERILGNRSQFNQIFIDLYL